MKDNFKFILALILIIGLFFSAILFLPKGTEYEKWEKDYNKIYNVKK